jgi:hypothetical protein
MTQAIDDLIATLEVFGSALTAIDSAGAAIVAALQKGNKVLS